ncbi:MAG: transcription antitermination factor NusB [Solirubrobacteraceae bacterium]
MLGRRQIRGKVMQSLYAYYLSNNKNDVVETYMKKGIGDIYDLYITLLSLLLKMKEESSNQIEIRKKKFLATKEDLTPNKKFVQNKILSILSVNNELKNYLIKNAQLNWTKNDPLVHILNKEIEESQIYKNFMSKSEITFKDDKEFILAIFSDIIAPSTLLEELMEEKHLHWLDDLHIANTMVHATIESFRENSREDLKLLRVYKDEQDKEFAINLFRETIEREKEIREIIHQKSTNWEIERIAPIDLVILQMALTEILYFTDIPHKVSINEYVEIAKNYSSPNSTDFINGILDNTITQFK